MKYIERMMQIIETILACTAITAFFHILNSLISYITVYVILYNKPLIPGMKNPEFPLLSSFVESNVPYLIILAASLVIYCLLNLYLTKTLRVRFYRSSIVIGFFVIADSSIRVFHVFRDIYIKMNSLVSIGAENKQYFGLVFGESALKQILINSIKLNTPKLTLIAVELILGVFIILIGKKKYSELWPGRKHF